MRTFPFETPKELGCQRDMQSHIHHSHISNKVSRRWRNLIKHWGLTLAWFRSVWHLMTSDWNGNRVQFMWDAKDDVWSIFNSFFSSKGRHIDKLSSSVRSLSSKSHINFFPCAAILWSWSCGAWLACWPHWLPFSTFHSVYSGKQ